MARYRTTIESTLSPEEAFDYLADFANAREWDPGVVEGDRLSGERIGLGSGFRLVSRFLGRQVPLEYRITTFQRPERVVLEAGQARLHSCDTIVVSATPGVTRVSYDAELRLAGVWRVLDPLLQLAFRSGAGRAAAGLRLALNP
jgi:hypothetical protein